MKPLQTDLSIFKKLKLEKPPVAINYCFHKPEGVEKLNKSLGLCEMVKEAQDRGKPFYFTKDDENCVGKMFLGMTEDPQPPRRSDGGNLGVKLQVFQSGRPNLRLRTFIPTLEKGSVNYMLYTPFDKIKYEPELFVVTGNPTQAELLLRAMTTTTGEMYESRSTVVGACSQLYIYPYVSGKVNYLVAGLSFGMRGRKIYPEGTIIVSIPHQWLPIIAQNLKDMEWVPGYNLTRDEFVERDHRITEENIRESQNP